MNSIQPQALDETAMAVAAITLGIQKLREVALGDTADRADQAKVLQALYDDANREGSVLPILSDLLSDLGLRFHDDGAEVLGEDLDEAAAYVGDYAGLRVNVARETLAQTCQECGQKKPDVREMPDPFAEALYPEDDHELMTLCHSCAVARFEES